MGNTDSSNSAASRVVQHVLFVFETEGILFKEGRLAQEKAATSRYVKNAQEGFDEYNPFTPMFLEKINRVGFFNFAFWVRLYCTNFLSRAHVKFCPVPLPRDSLR